jgi:hypothetical protein
MMESVEEVVAETIELAVELAEAVEVAEDKSKEALVWKLERIWPLM